MSSSGKKNGRGKGRRRFLKTMTLGVGTLALPAGSGALPNPPESKSIHREDPAREQIQYPRVFRGRRRDLITFPLGGVGAGSIGLGGRGQLKEWWIFNRPDKGRSPQYAFAALWIQAGNEKPTARVLEARITPPYERGPDGLGWANAPGLPRLESSTFTGEYPLATVDFEDASLPVQVGLQAFTPFIPLDADDSGLPVAVLRYQVKNPSSSKARVAIAFSIENPVAAEGGDSRHGNHGRQNDYRKSEAVEGLLMRNPFLSKSDPQAGTFALSLLEIGDGQVSYLRGWPGAQWWENPRLFWEDFSADGQLDPGTPARTPVGSLCLSREIASRGKGEYTFLLSWHFPNRTPNRCGWRAPHGHENDLIGNYYSTRFADAWKVAEYTSKHLSRLEARTRRFLSVMRNTTLPDSVRDAAMANLSTLTTPTCFRTSDGSFHGFEGCSDRAGCCYGNCTHVYAYEAATAHVFPSLSRSFREQQFGFLTDEDGRMDYRELLPYGIERSGVPAADGQMACILKAYLDWQLSGDTEWLRRLWPNVQRALEFAWIKGGWDANQDGVMEGVQHNTYDVEFIGPNPFCEMWYLAALRAGESMARAVGEASPADKYSRLFRNGSIWTDANLFNGEFYVQKIGSIAKDEVAKGLLEGAGTTDTKHPTYQVGDGCLSDQLMGQYFTQIAGLGLLVDGDHIQNALRSIWKYNYKENLANHVCVQRAYAINNEAGLVLCEYPNGGPPRVPFPYFAEVWSGSEYAAAALMIYMGMVSEGVQIVENTRRRFDGEKRNPWSEAECGYHYARPMASWATVPALSGFRYHGAEKSVVAQPRINQDDFLSFWSAGTGWGSFAQRRQAGKTHFTLSVAEGKLEFRSVTLKAQKGAGAGSSGRLGRKALVPEIRQKGDEVTFVFTPEVILKANDHLLLTF